MDCKGDVICYGRRSLVFELDGTGSATSASIHAIGGHLSQSMGDDGIKPSSLAEKVKQLLEDCGIGYWASYLARPECDVGVLDLVESIGVDASSSFGCSDAN